MNQRAQRLRLCILLEGTAALLPLWSSLRMHYIDPLLRSLEQAPAKQYELALVLFQCGHPYSRCSLERGGWTTDMITFKQWLDTVMFDGGGKETQLTEALAEALYLFQAPSQLGDLGRIERQCILVAQSEPTKAGFSWAFFSDGGQMNSRLVSCKDLAKQLPVHGINLSILMQNTPRSGVRNQLMQLFALAAQADSKEMITGESAITKDLLRSTYKGLTQGSFMLVSPQWPAALAVLENERKRLAEVQQARLAEPRQAADQLAATPRTDSPAMAYTPVAPQDLAVMGMVPGVLPPPKVTANLYSESYQASSSPAQAAANALLPASPAGQSTTPGSFTQLLQGGTVNWPLTDTAAAHPLPVPSQLVTAPLVTPGQLSQPAKQLPGTAGQSGVPLQPKVQTLWQGWILLSASALQAPQPLQLAIAQAVVSSDITIDSSSWPPQLVVEKLIDYRSAAMVELARKHNNGLQGRFIQRPETISSMAADVLNKMLDSRLAGTIRLPGLNMIFIVSTAKSTDRGQHRLGFVLLPS